MITKGILSRFHARLFEQNYMHPVKGHLDLTYRCAFDCLHCYCKGRDRHCREMATGEWKKIIDAIHREGCLWLVISGGDPVIRDDFLDIYSYCKRKGFLISLYTNLYSLNNTITRHLIRYPPHTIEVTVNGITKETFESITQVTGSFAVVMQRLRYLKAAGVRLIIKANCLKQNIHELVKIKEFSEKLLGKPRKGMYYFKYDPLLTPHLDGSKKVCENRVPYADIAASIRDDPDMWRDYCMKFKCNPQPIARDRKYLYACDQWRNAFVIDPRGRLKFCLFSDKFSVDLKQVPFKEGFYNFLPQILEATFKTDSPCRACTIRNTCLSCPAFAFLETGDEEAPSDYHCTLARTFQSQHRLFRRTNNRPDTTL